MICNLHPITRFPRAKRPGTNVIIPGNVIYSPTIVTNYRLLTNLFYYSHTAGFTAGDSRLFHFDELHPMCRYVSLMGSAHQFFNSFTFHYFPIALCARVALYQHLFSSSWSLSLFTFLHSEPVTIHRHFLHEISLPFFCTIIIYVARLIADTYLFGHELYYL